MKIFEIIADVVEKLVDVVVYIITVGVLGAAGYFFARWLIGG